MAKLIEIPKVAIMATQLKKVPFRSAEDLLKIDEQGNFRFIVAKDGEQFKDIENESIVHNNYSTLIN